MSSKNTSPFLVQTWSVEGWTDGWTIAKPFTVQSGAHLFILKSSGYGGDDKNVHICFLNSDGTLGPKKFTKKWSEGWTTAEIYTASGKTYLLLLKRSGSGSDGNNVHIHEVLGDGDIGDKLFVRKLDPGWTQARVYTVGDASFLFLLKESDGAVCILGIESGGKIGTQIINYDWSDGWTSVEFYQVGESTYLFLMKEDGGSVHIHKMNSDGTVGTRVTTYNWSDGWTHAKAFRAAGRSYLLLLKQSTGTVHINHLKENGTLGEHVCQYARDPLDYTTAFGTGSLADSGPRPWTPGWTTIEFVELGKKPHLFCLKRQLTGNQEKRAKIYRVTPMQSVGPMVSYVATNHATIWVGTVGSAIDGAVRYWSDSEAAASETALEFGGGEYYRAGVGRLAGLKHDTAYSYKLSLGGNLFGSGTFRTAPPSGRGKFTVAVVSCMDLHDDRVQAVWQHVLAQQPAVLLQVGDNAYPNTTMRSMIWAEHLQQRGVRHFANIICQVPTLATWDDHDFGPNNSAGADVEKAHRAESRDAFRELFPGLPYAASAGIHYKTNWGDVEFFMLDNRYFRNHYLRGSPLFRTMLGPGQWTWLEQAVEASSARFKVIISGTTISGSRHTAPPSETWEDYPLDLVRLMRLAGGYPGVILVSGDMHVCSIEHHSLGGNRKLWEVVSSGISGQEGNEHAFATLEFDTRVSGSEKVSCRLFRQDGSERPDGKTILLSTIT